MPNYLIRCGTLIDATGADPRASVDIEIAGDTIVGIVPRGTSTLADATVVDLSELTVLPGLFDCHEHLGLNFGTDEYEQGSEPLDYYAIKSAINAETILRSGITTIRTAGDQGSSGTAVKRAIEEGIVRGPRVITARRLIARTGGHGWVVGHEVDGPDGFRAGIREEVKLGADVIKIMVSGGASTAGSEVLAQELTDEEIVAAIDEAHLRGRRIMAHGHGGPGVRVAVRAGIDSIEHGAKLTTDDLDLMAEFGTTLVVTSVYGLRVASGTYPDIPQHVVDKVKGSLDEELARLRYVAGIGLKVAVGSDSVHGAIWEELKVLSQYGFSPMRALQAGTISGAELCGLGDKLGTLEVGKLADIIAVQGNPLDDLGVLAEVPFVMKAGTVYYAPSSADRAARFVANTD